MKTLFLVAAVLFIVCTIDAAPRPKPTTKPGQQALKRSAPKPGQQALKRSAPKSGQQALKRSVPKPVTKSKSVTKSVSKPNYNRIVGYSQTQKRVVPRQVTLKLNRKQKRQLFDLFNGGSVYPNYYVQHPSPFAPFQNAFLRAVFQPGAHLNDFNSLLKQANLTDANGKLFPLEARTGAAFETAFGDKNATNITTTIFSFDHSGNVNIINPFLAAKDFDGKLLHTDNGVPGFKTGKEYNGKAVSLVNPYHGSALDPVFGPEIAPRYEIHYTPQDFRPIATSLSGAGLQSHAGFNGAGFHNSGFSGADFNSAGFGGSGFGGAGFGGAGFGSAGFSGLGLGGYEFGLHPSFNNAAFGPYPLPLIPGFDPKSLKPPGKDDKGHDTNKPDSSSSTEQSAETTSESFQESSSESSSESSNSETSSESSSETSSETSQ